MTDFDDPADPGLNVDHLPLARHQTGRFGDERYQAMCICGWEGERFWPADTSHAEARTRARMAAEAHLQVVEHHQTEVAGRRERRR